MNKWERETFVPRLAKRAMSEKEFKKISREYDRNTHDNTRLAMNSIHETVNALIAVNDLVKNTEVSLQIQCPNTYKLADKWTRKGFLNELKSGPMDTDRFEAIMEEVASTNTRKFRDEWDAQRNIANSIWNKVDCGKLTKLKAKATVA